MARSNQAPPTAAAVREKPRSFAKTAFEGDSADALPSRNLWRMDWCTLLKRTYDFDVLRCAPFPFGFPRGVHEFDAQQRLVQSFANLSRGYTSHRSTLYGPRPGR